MSMCDGRFGVTRAVLAALCGGLAAGAAASCGGDAGPVEMLYMYTAGRPVRYVTTYQQAIEVDMGNQPMTATRDFRVGFTLDGENVTLDSLRAAIISAQGRQAIDSRHLIGEMWVMHVPPRGGMPHYMGETPAVNMGAMSGGELPTAWLVDYTFPHLPTGVVEPGATWSSEHQRTHVEGSSHILADLVTEYTFVGYETVDGVRAVRVESVTAGQLTSIEGGEDEDESQAWVYEGTLSGTATWFFDPATGTLLKLTAHEESDGSTSLDEMSAGISQTTDIEVQRIAH